jgi:hypothetical protein
MILLDTNVVIDAQNKTSPFFNCFLRTKMDLLVLGNFHIQRKSRDEQRLISSSGSNWLLVFV